MSAVKAAAVTDARREWVAQNPLRRRRRALRLSIHATAAALPASVSAIQQWESGAVRPTDASMEKLATFFGMDATSVRSIWTRWERSQPGLHD